MVSSNNLNEAPSSDEISLRELMVKVRSGFYYLLAKWPIVLVFSLTGGLIGFTYAFYKKPVYTASTTFVLEEGGGGMSSSLVGLASTAGVDLGTGGGGIFQGDNILSLYKSRKMIEKTLFTEILVDGKKQLLIDRYIKSNNLKQDWDQVPRLKGLRFGHKRGRLHDSIVGSIVTDINKRYLSVEKPDKKLSLIKADVSSEDEVFAKEFNDQIVKNVNDFYVQTKTKKSLDNVAILQQKVDSVRSVMNNAIYAAAAIVDATPNLNPTRQLQRAVPMQRSQFSAEGNKIMLNILVQNLEMSKMSLRKETPLIQVIDQPILPLEKQRFGRAKGTILGGVVFGFLGVICLIIRKIFFK